MKLAKKEIDSLEQYSKGNCISRYRYFKVYPRHVARTEFYGGQAKTWGAKKILG